MRTVAIVGSQIKTRDLAPFDDPTIDIWVFNEAASKPWCKRADAVFQLHAPAIYRSPHNRSDPAHWDWLRKTHDGLTVYMQDVDPLVPCSIRYPLSEICAALLPAFRQGIEPVQTRYFTSTVAYALALAVYQEYDKILIYGVEMESDTEYWYQRPCVLFWVGVALGRGIAIDFISGESIFDVPIYGYDGILETNPEMFVVRANELRAQVAELLDKKAAIEKDMRAGSNLNGNLKQITDSLINVYGELGKVEGALAENESYLYKANEMITQDGLAYIDRTEYESQAAVNKLQADTIVVELHRLYGRLDYVLHAWERTHDPRALEQVKTFAMAACEVANKTGRATGIYEENARYVDELDRRIQAAGGEKAAEMLREV